MLLEARSDWLEAEVTALFKMQIKPTPCYIKMLQVLNPPKKNEHRNQAKYFPPIKSYYKNFFLIHHRMLDSHNEAHFKMSLAKLLDF